jgi:hypothetical protein
MARDERPAVVYLRMSPQRRDGLRQAAAITHGCGRVNQRPRNLEKSSGTRGVSYSSELHAHNT